MAEVIELTPGSWLVGWRPGIQELDTVTVISATGPDMQVPWGSVVAHTHGAVLDMLPTAKSVTADVVKVGPKGYIHGWIFVGVPGVGDQVHHPEHGKGTVTSHDDKHVTVAFAGGKSHSFEVHRKDGETSHFTKRGDLEHAGPHAPKRNPADALALQRVKPKDLSDEDLHAADAEFTRRATLRGTPTLVSRTHQSVKDELARRAAAKAPKEEHPADRVFRDPEEAKKLTDVQLGSARDELLARHEKVGIWGDEAAKYDRVRAAVDEEQYTRRMVVARSGGMSKSPGVAEFLSDKDLADVRRVTERKAAEQSVHPDLLPGHRAARVEQARRADPSAANWSVDKLHIFGGSPEDQVRTETAMKKLASDIPPEKMATLAHVNITDANMKTAGEMGLYFPQERKLEINPNVLTAKSDAIAKDCEQSGWFSKTGHPDSLMRTLDHELGHHLDFGLGHHVDLGSTKVPVGVETRERMFASLSHLMGSTPLKRSQGRLAVLHVSRADEYVAANKADIINSVGTYASTNSYELVAELWAEYHGKKLNGIAPTDQFKTSQVVGRALVGHDTPYNPEEG